MSKEFNVRAPDVTPEVFAKVASAIKVEFPSATVSVVQDSLWIPSASPDWIGFSVESTADGVFIVSNLNGREDAIIFQIVGQVLLSSGIAFSVEEE